MARLLGLERVLAKWMAPSAAPHGRDGHQPPRRRPRNRLAALALGLRCRPPVEVVAAGAMAAQGRRNRWSEARERDAERLESLALARAKLERKLAAQGSELAALWERVTGRDGTTFATAPKRPRQRRQRNRSRSARSSGSESAAREVPCRNGCGWVGRSQNAENAHPGGCPAAADNRRTEIGGRLGP